MTRATLSGIALAMLATFGCAPRERDGGATTERAALHRAEQPVQPSLGNELATDAANYATQVAVASVPLVDFDGSNHLVVWADARRPIGREIVGARVSPLGEVLDPAGFVIGATMLGTPSATSVGGDYTLVVWADPLEGIHAARVTSSGNVLDDPAIIIAQTATGGAADFDGTHHVVAWRTGHDISATRVSPAGQIVATTLLKSPTASWMVGPEVACGAGVCLVAWLQGELGGSRLLGKRLSPGGDSLDETPIVIAATLSPAGLKVSPDGAGFLLVWQEFVNSEASGISDIYGARLSAEGEALDPSPFPIVSTPAQESAPSVEFDGTHHFVVWTEGDAGAVTTFATRVSPAGAVLDPGAEPLLLGISDHSVPQPSFDGENQLLVMKTQHVVASRASAEGVVLDPAPVVVSTSANRQTGASVAGDGTRYLLVWSDSRNEQTTGVDLYGVLVDASGTATQGSVVRISALPRDELGKTSVAFGGGVYLVVFTHWDGTKHRVSAVRVSGDGAVLDAAPIEVTAAGHDAFGNAAVASDGEQFLVVWAGADPDLRSSLFGARVSADGVVLDSTPFVAIDTPNGADPAISYGDGQYLVACTESDAQPPFDILLARVARDGSVFVAPRFTASTTYSVPSATLAFDGTEWLVVWTEARGGTQLRDMYATRVAANGVIIDASVRISSLPEDEQAPALTHDGRSFVAVWQYEDAFGWDLAGTRFSLSGLAGEPDITRLVVEDDIVERPVVASDGHGGALLAYDRYSADRAHRAPRVFARRWAASSALGQPCAEDAHCASEHCADGVCCDAACTGQCEACNMSGSEGTCSAVAGPPRGSRPECGGTGVCMGACDGTARQACAFPGSNVQCSERTCSANVQRAVGTCSGAGFCGAVETVCAPFTCGATACQTTCATSDDCAAGFVCQQGGCVPPALPSADGGTDAGPDATLIEPRGGCSCRVVPRSARGPRVVGAVLGLAGLVACRRRRRQ